MTIKKKGAFTTKYTIKIRPADAFGFLASVLLIFTPLFNKKTSVGLGIILLIMITLSHFSKKKD